MTKKLLLTYIAKSKHTSDLGKLVSPFETAWISKTIAYILAAFFYFDIVVMSSAGGSLIALITMAGNSALRAKYSARLNPIIRCRDILDCYLLC